MARESLGTTLRDDDPPQAQRQWTTALDLIERYTDPRAAQARQRITGLLTGADTNGEGAGA